MWGFQLLGSSANAACGHAGIQLLMPQVHARLCQDCTLPWKWFGKSATCRLENSFRRCSNACLPPEVRESFLNSLGSTTSGAEFALARPGSFFLSPGLRWGPLMGTTWTLWWRRVCEAFRESSGSSGSYHPEPELSGASGPGRAGSHEHSQRPRRWHLAEACVPPHQDCPSSTFFGGLWERNLDARTKKGNGYEPAQKASSL